MSTGIKRKRCTRSQTRSQLLLQDVRILGTLLSRTTSIDLAWLLLAQISFVLDRSIEESSDGRGSNTQALTFASTRALTLILNHHRNTVSLDTSGLRIRGDSVRDFRLKICIAIQGRFACDGDGPPLFAHFSKAFVIHDGQPGLNQITYKTPSQW